MARGRFTPMLLAGAAGAALAWLFDPERGRSRRARLSDQAGARFRGASRTTSQKLDYLAGQAQGAAAKATGAGRDTAPDDATLRQQVKQAMSTLDFPTDGVVVDAHDGKVVLRGEVEDPDQQKAVELVATGVDSAADVESWLHLPGTPPPNKAASLKAS